MCRYCLSPSYRQVGKFLLSYLPGRTARHEYVTLTPRGLRFRHKVNSREFRSLEQCLAWFKQHYKELPPEIGASLLSVSSNHKCKYKWPAALRDPLNEEINRIAEQMRKAQTPSHPSQTPSAYSASLFSSSVL